MIRVLIVDDHQLVRAGVRAILEPTEDIQVVAEAADGAEALRLIQQIGPDVVLMDIQMPSGMGGIEATRRIRRLTPEVRILALSALFSDPMPALLQEAGAHGYLTKGCPASELLNAIRTIHDGLPYVDAGLAQHRAITGWRGSRDAPFKELSAREMQVVMMVLEGRQNRDIAAMLSLSQKTISTYRKRIYEKLGIETDVELARLAYRHGMICEDGGSFESQPEES